MEYRKYRYRIEKIGIYIIENLDMKYRKYRYRIEKIWI